jgi:hypothetical protein
MPKKPASASTEAEWEVTNDVVIRRPLGIVLSTQFNQHKYELIAQVAEAYGLTTVEYLR